MHGRVLEAKAWIALNMNRRKVWLPFAGYDYMGRGKKNGAKKTFKAGLYISLLFGFCVAAASDIRQQGPGSQITYLKAANPDKDDVFGTTIALSGNTLVVGAWGESSNATGVNGIGSNNTSRHSGAAYVFVYTPATGWVQQAYLKASNTNAGDNFGNSVAISGDTIVIGARYEDSSATGVNGDESDNQAGDSGAAYVFVRSADTWTQQAYLKASNSGIGDHFGTSVAISGDTIVVGARGEDSSSTGVDGDATDNLASDSGAAYVYVRDGNGNWSQQAYLKASNTDAGDAFGVSVAIDGETVAVGSVFEDSNAKGIDGDQSNNSATDSGAAYIFSRTGSSWSQQAYIKSANADEHDYFAGALDISGDTLLIGAVHEDSNATGVNGDQSNNSASGRSSGAAYVFTRTGQSWLQTAYLKASNTGREDWFGHSVAILGDEAIVGARLEDSGASGVNGSEGDQEGYDDAGAAYFFVRNDGEWTQLAYLKASNTDRQDFFGMDVDLSDGLLVVGASHERSAASGINGDGSDNSIHRAGAVYSFHTENTDLLFANGFEN